MTNEQIKTARSELRSWCRVSMSIPPNRDEQAILKLIDALCAAARKPDSLVGRRVRSTRLGRGVVESGPLWKVSFRLGDSMTRSMDLVRDDFELIDGGEDAK